VYAGIRTFRALEKLPVAANETAEIIKAVNDIFDLLNVRNPAKKMLNAEDLVKLGAFREKVKLWSANGKVLPCFHALLLNLNSTELLTRHLIDNANFKYLLTGRMTQDCLKNFFAQVRSRGGHRNNPSAVEFRFAFRTLSTNMMLTPVTSGNCEYSSDELLMSMSSLSQSAASGRKRKLDDTQNERSTKLVKVAPAEPHVLVECIEDFQVSSLVANVVTYIGGYLLQRIHDACGECMELLTDRSAVVQETHLLCHFKAYRHQ